MKKLSLDHNNLLFVYSSNVRFSEALLENLACNNKIMNFIN